MAADNLLLELAPPLLEALELSGHAGKLDYFALLGIQRSGFAAADVDRAVMARSKALRPWQNSPQYGPDIVKLLPMLHRIAAILKDPVRRDAYAKEVDRVLSGAPVDAEGDFREIVRAACADGKLDEASKSELLKYASAHGIASNEAAMIVNEFTATMKKARPAAEEADRAWEFKLSSSEGGAEAFTEAVNSMLDAGIFNKETSARFLGDAGKFGIDSAHAASLMRSMAAAYFRRMVEGVAQGGAINENQAKLLMPKAAGLGIAQDRAFEILSDFTFTGASQEDLASLHLTVSAFDQGEIEGLLAHQNTVLYDRRGNIIARAVTGLFTTVPGWIVLAIAVIGGGIYLYGGSSAGSRRVISPPAFTPAQTPGDNANTNATSAAAKNEPWKNPKPDPVSGMLPIEPEQPTDPPAFDIKITEVTCAEYQKFLKDTFYKNYPAGWSADFSFPAGSANKPVTGIPWADAEAYLQWLARSMKLQPGAIRFPNEAEFRRLTRAPMKSGVGTSQPSFWKAVGLNKITQLSDAKANKDTDTLYFPTGQVYDLFNNVREWGQDEKGGKRLVYGGDHTMKTESFDVEESQYEDPTAASPTLGFRYVVVK